MSTETKAYLPILALILALMTDLLSPFLIARGMIPASLRWISQGMIALILFWLILRMLAFKHIPGIFWLIILISITGVSSAVLRGQGIPVTMWGWWLLFQFPIIGLFTYLQPDWPRNFPRIVLFSCVAILAGEVLLQILLYWRGMVPGDHLSGTFGWNGTGYLVLFILLILCLALGEWIAARIWVPVLLTLSLGIISSALGEMKIFLPLLFVLGLFSLGFFIIKSRDRLKLIPYSLIFFLILAAFLAAYNGFVPAARQVPLEKFLSDPQSLMRYVNASTRFVAGQNIYTDIGRNFALQYGWKQLSGDPLALLFGIGLGSRAESSALGMAGQGLIQGELGISTGTSLLVMMQEIGITGLIAIFGFFLFIIYRLFIVISQVPDSNANGLRYGLILFTLLWPILLWYNTAWTARVAMLLYWGLLGYALRGSRKPEPLRCPVYPGETYIPNPATTIYRDRAAPLE